MNNDFFSLQRWIVLSIVLLFQLGSLFSQNDCDCISITEINVCYLDRNTYCDSNSFGNCGITLNHKLQSEGIVQKLKNENNFGHNGKVKCKINIIPLDKIEEISDITSHECHVFYSGNFPDEDSDFDKTILSETTLSTIFNWSNECSRNLAIVPQKEAELWGYSIEDENTNPNSSVIGTNPFFSVFDGPFGIAESFNQGGTYQGVITDFPTSGHTVLAIDALRRPTIALDHVSSDLIIGDIGFFSIPQAGDLSFGDSISTSNDILACNIFALACQLVGEYLFQSQNILLNAGESYILPDGEIATEEGNYLDTITNSIGCDTVINTQINFRINEIEGKYKSQIPNIFSPNGDFVNDDFRLFLPSDQYQYFIEIQNFTIFDRWGNTIKNIENDIFTNEYILWDGRINGAYGQNGVYIYQFDLKYNNTINRYKGDITLYR